VEKRITTVIFDFGGVLGLPQDQGLVASMAALCRLPVAEFVRLCWLDREGYDRGTRAAPSYWGEMLRAGGVEPTPDHLAEIVRQDSASWTRVNTSTLAWSRELRSAGYRTAILSNMPAETLQYIRSSDALRWVEEFVPAVYSCDYGEIKPNAGLFRVCLERLGAAPGECVFVDDSAANVEGARALGINAVRYESARQVADAVSAWGVPVEALRASTPEVR
jgi:putative hydrolase of the HAD superfamily